MTTTKPATRKPHYIGMAGLHGCLPACCEVFKTAGAAADYLRDVHELSKNKRKRLRRDSYLELSLEQHGNEYCEITECWCETPDIHSDSGEGL